MRKIEEKMKKNKIKETLQQCDEDVDDENTVYYLPTRYKDLDYGDIFKYCKHFFLKIPESKGYSNCLLYISEYKKFTEPLYIDENEIVEKSDIVASILED